MKGLKTLTATLSRRGAAGRPAPASAGAARLQPLRRLRGLPERETRARLPEERAKRAPSSKATTATVFYTVCVRFPEGKHLCAPREEAVRGNALREQDHVQHRRQASGQLVRRRQESRRPSSSGSRPSLALLGFDTATQDTAVCAWRDGEVLSRVAARASRRTAAPDTRRGCWGRSRRRPRRRGLGGGGGDRGRPRARDPSPGCGSESPPPGASARRSGLPVMRRLHAGRPRPAARAPAAGDRAAAAGRRSTPAAARSSRRSTRRRASGSGSPGSGGPAELCERLGRARAAAAGGRIGGATIS